MPMDSNQKQERSVPHGEDLRAIQPYNFIPFACDENGKKQSPPRQPLDAYYPPAAGLKSGWIDVKLTAKTPLIIPDGAQHDEIPVSERAEQKNRASRTHKRYRFFRFPDHTCGIPGSELRGMIRSMYEAATNSCLPFLLEDPKRPISQRTPIYGAFKDRGLLEYDSEKKCWRLLKVKKHLIPTNGYAVQKGIFQWGDAEYHTAQKVQFSSSSEGISLGQGAGEGVIQFNIPVDLRNNYNVAVLEPIGVEYEWPPGDKSAYNSVNGSVWDTVENVNRHGQKGGAVTTQSDLERALERAERGDGTQVPVYWSRVERTLKEDGDTKTIPLYYLSGAAAGRVQQRRKWADIMGEHRPCDSLNALCPACALFGTADAKETADMDGTEDNRMPSKDRGARGRLRFTDAHAVTEPKITSHILQILGGPRSSSFEFYLRKPAKNATYWNYDYYGLRQTAQTHSGGTVEWTEYHDLPEATPRGRKFYWHTSPAPDDDTQRQLNTTMEAVSAGSQFTFRVYFDRITKEQLQDLLWLISLGENREDSHLQYKLGHAKPLGYGSVKLTVTDCVIRELDADFSMRIQREEVPEYPERPAGSLPMNNDTMRAILRMSDSRATGGKPVEYLTGMDYVRREQREKPIIYAWFRENRINADAVLTLPEPWDTDLTLPTQRRSKRKGGNGGRANRDPATYAGGESSQTPVQEERLAVTITENAELAKQRQETQNRIGQEVECTVTDVRGQTVFVTLKESGEKCRFTAKKKAKYKPRQTVRAKITAILPDSTPKLEVL